MRRFMILATLSVAVQASLLGVVAAEETAMQTKTGIVKKVDTSASQIVVLVARELTFTVTEATRILQGGEARQLADVRVVRKVSVDYSREGDTRTAKRIAILAIEPKGEQPAEKAEHEIKPGGTLTIEFPDMPQTFFAMQQKKNVPAQMTVYLPTNYDPAKEFPLLIWLNGGDGGDGTTLGVARGITQGRDFICVSVPLFKASLAPVSGPKGPRPGFVINAADGKFMWPHFKTMLDKLEKSVANIDPAHRVLGGFSNGAHATAALIDESYGEVARRFSAFVFVEGGGKLQQYDLLKGKPVLMVSSNAKSQPRAQEICDAAKAAGAKATLVVEDVGAHDFPVSAYPAVRSWLRGAVAK